MGAEQVHSHTVAQVIDIAGLAGEIDHAGSPAAELRREAALVNPDVLDRIRIESAEHPEKMVHVVDSHAIEQDQVLVRGSAPDVEPGGTVADPADTG